jgi:hypothetical protein
MCWEIVKFYQFSKIWSCPDTEWFIRIRILLKFFDPTGSGSTLLILMPWRYKCCKLFKILHFLLTIMYQFLRRSIPGITLSCNFLSILHFFSFLGSVRIRIMFYQCSAHQILTASFQSPFPCQVYVINFCLNLVILIMGHMLYYSSNYIV